MISGKSFLKQLDEVKFESQTSKVAEQLKGSTHVEDIAAVVESLDIEEYKKPALVEYLDKNKDKLLSLSTYTEGDPVQVSDDFAPHAHKQGKVISKGSVAGTYKVKFEDGEYDIPEHHITRKDAVATESRFDTPLSGFYITDKRTGQVASKPFETKDLAQQHLMQKMFANHQNYEVKGFEQIKESDIVHDEKKLKLGGKQDILKKITEHKCLALLENGALVKVILESLDGAEQLIEEQIGESVHVVFPEAISESFVEEVTEMTDEQKKKREDIVMGLKQNKTDLQKRYGDRWESVMYAIATKKAMGESLDEATQDVIFKHKTDKGIVKIIKNGEYFNVELVGNDGKLVDSHEYSDIKEAEKAAQEMI